MRTLKHPRTMTEAFGPYTSNRIDESELERLDRGMALLGKFAYTLIGVMILAGAATWWWL